ncbi:MAG: endonuclease/exonuclease/phosphatase family protein [Dysgonamonadaceae bacterium]|jgi:endonuclease/exonuclease/phosphatase family metal-dependent hydrolase|nr:endonuclease/exonuclease/phosphatase family protein [Dysgonamonadaceae bacterium]
MPVSKKQSIIGKIYNSTIFTINIVLIFLLVLSAYSDRISPADWVVFSFLGIGFPFILILNLLFLLWWLIFFRWKQSIICLIGLLLCWNTIRAYIPLHSQTPDVPANCIKVLTYNVMGFNNTQPHRKNNPNPVLQFIIDSHADIVCIQEHRSHAVDGLLSAEQLKKALAMYPYSHLSPPGKRSYKDGTYGLSIYSKFPILATKKIPFYSEYNGAFLSTLDVHGKKLLLVNCHLETNRLSDEERKQYSDFVKNPGSKKIDAVAGSAFKKLKPAFKIRASQAEKVAEAMQQEQSPYVVVCGDFNDTPISYALHKIQGNLNDAFVETGRGLGITYNQNRFYFRIDHILHSKNIRAYNCSVGNLKASDHYPVWAWLQLN